MTVAPKVKQNVVDINNVSMYLFGNLKQQQAKLGIFNITSGLSETILDPQVDNDCVKTVMNHFTTQFNDY